MEIPTKELFEKNLEFLRSRMSETTYSELTKNNGTSASSLSISENNGAVGYHVKRNGKEILLHSRRDPTGEAERQIENWAEKENVNWQETIVVFGFAGMHHILSIARRLKPSGMLFIAENTKDAFLKALEHCNLSELERKTEAEIFFSVSDRHEIISNEYRYKLRYRKRLKTRFFVHPGVHRAFPEKYDFLLKSLARETRIETINRGSRAAYSEVWQKNALKNLPATLSNAPIDILKESFNECTGLVLGAGPSLNNAIPHIKACQDDFLIITVGTALKPLLQAEIIPDLIVAIDWDPLTLKQYEGTSTVNLFLAAEPIIDARLIEMFSGRLFLFASNTLSGHNEWLESFDALPERLSVGGTVTFTATDLARHMGCKDIIFAGFDLCMADDGTTHAAGSMYSGKKSNKGDLIEVQGNYGKKVLTTRQFRTYIDMMNSYLYCESYNNNACFRNATQGGALLNHAPAISPETLPDIQHKRKPENKKEALEKLFRKAAGKRDWKKAAENGERTMEELENIKKFSDNAIEACRILGSGENIKYSNMLRNELDKIDAKIKENHLANMLVNGALQPLIMEIFSEDDAPKTPEETLEESLNFYSHVKKTSSELENILGSSLAEIKNKNNQ